MKYYANKEKKYIGGSDHGQVVDGAVFETVVHPDFWDAETEFLQITEFEDEAEPVNEGGEDLGKQQD